MPWNKDTVFHYPNAPVISMERARTEIKQTAFASLFQYPVFQSYLQAPCSGHLTLALYAR